MTIPARHHHRTLIAATSFALVGGLAAAAPAAAAPEPPAAPAATVEDQPWRDTSLEPRTRAELLVEALTEEQKLTQLSMRPFAEPVLPCEYYSIARQVRGIPELGLPTMRYVNGPTGVGGSACASEPQFTTPMPASVGVGASFDPELSRQWGEITGNEVKGIGHNVFLTPGINLVPNATGGRAYEYFGEDPYLTGTMGVAQVQGIESQGIQATPKHYVANEQETERWTMAVNLDQRALNELQMIPFEMVVRESDPAAIMCAYPMVNGTWACESDYLLDKRLRQDWGFSGYVMSDRGAVHSTADSLNAGMDLEFGSPLYYSTTRLREALDAGEITWDTVDRALERRFTPMFKLGQFEHDWDQLTPIDHAGHDAQAQSIASQGMVLMKNDGDLLPLDADKLAGMGDILMVGPDEVVKNAKLGNNGPNSTVGMDEDLHSRPILALREELASHGYRGHVHESNGSDLATTSQLATQMDAVVVVLTDFASEFYDRGTLELEPATNDDGSTTDQLELAKAMAAANDNVIVVLKTSNSVLTNEFEDDVDAIVQAWYPGQADGAAVADVLSGDVNPGAKMPITWATQNREASWAEERNFPGVWEDGQLTSYYTTGLELGYRWYQANDVESSFPFGFGLSYTDFRIDQPAVSLAGGTVQVTARVTNTGERTGAEVPQVYLSFPDSFGEPPLRLVGYEKVELAPGESRTVLLEIDPEASNHPVGIFDVDADRWVNPDGEIAIHLGNSSKEPARVGSLTMRGGVPVAVTSTDGVVTEPEEPQLPPRVPAIAFYNDGWSGVATSSTELTEVREGDEFFAGDWDGDGTDSLAIRRGNQLLLWNNDGSGEPAVSYWYGKPEDEVFVGDWDGDGRDTFAVRRGNTFHIRNVLTSGNAEYGIDFGRAGDEVLVGDFAGNGRDSLAVRRENHIFINNAMVDGPADQELWYGRPGEPLFVGDWDGDGRETFTVRRGNEWHVRNTLTTGNAEFVEYWGRADDFAAAGDFNGDGRATITIIRLLD